MTRFNRKRDEEWPLNSNPHDGVELVEKEETSAQDGRRYSRCFYSRYERFAKVYIAGCLSSSISLSGKARTSFRGCEYFILANWRCWNCEALSNPALV